MQHRHRVVHADADTRWERVAELRAVARIVPDGAGTSAPDVLAAKAVARTVPDVANALPTHEGITRVAANAAIDPLAHAFAVTGVVSDRREAGTAGEESVAGIITDRPDGAWRPATSVLGRGITGIVPNDRGAATVSEEPVTRPIANRHQRRRVSASRARCAVAGAITDRDEANSTRAVSTNPTAITGSGSDRQQRWNPNAVARAVASIVRHGDKG